ncbi:MAG TPA: SWIM zinc finger family protein [Bryobacteraceae bacterium]|nr:SWIM zinc finger family protein [Bryobacteraceae bacterium]
MADYGWGWRPYVSVAQRRQNAARELAKRRKKGQVVSPVVVEGRTIAKTFWGKAWCDNLERYSDYANRLPRGRTYVRNGSVIDLQIAPGTIQALVSGSEIYEVEVKVTPVAKARWKSICEDCAGAIDSLVELLQGKFSNGVMERICRQNAGLFPSPKEIELSCSCPDWAGMCKHVAAVLYGIGARFDHQPELLFRLHNVDHGDLISKAGTGLPLSKTAPAAGKILKGGDLSGIFGLEMDPDGGAAAGAKKARAAKKGVAAKAVKGKTKKKSVGGKPKAAGKGGARKREGQG